MLRKEKIFTYASALTKIEEEAIRWNRRLNSDVLILPGIGEFSLNAENKLRFLPHGKVNFDANALGLTAFQNPHQSANQSCFGCANASKQFL